jgi:hypothetical protein
MSYKPQVLALADGGTGADIASANTGVFVTSNSGVPSILNASTIFQPTITGSVASGTVGYATSRVGYYVQIGPLIIYSFTVAGTITGSPSGNFQLSLPVAAASNNVPFWGPGFCNMSSDQQSGGYTIASGASIATFQTYTGSTIALAAVTYNVSGTICYFAA